MNSCLADDGENSTETSQPFIGTRQDGKKACSYCGITGDFMNYMGSTYSDGTSACGPCGRKKEHDERKARRDT